MAPIKERMPAMLVVDDLEEIRNAAELLYMAGIGCAEETDGRAIKTGAAYAVMLINNLIAKIEAAG